jgi:hypothetical protein
MANINHGSGDLDANALVAVAGASLALLQDKLDIALSRFHFPALHSLVQWWPILLILSGLIVLVVNWNAKGAWFGSKPSVSAAQRELTHER